MFYYIKITNTLIWMVKAFSEFESNLTAVERIKEYCDLEHEVLNNLLFSNSNYKLK